MCNDLDQDGYMTNSLLSTTKTAIIVVIDIDTAIIIVCRPILTLIYYISIRTIRFQSQHAS